MLTSPGLICAAVVFGVVSYQVLIFEMIGGALAATVFCVHQAIHNANDTLTTNFSTANLSGTSFDRASFKKAKSVGGWIDRINWQD
jgi:hypothetical protein